MFNKEILTNCREKILQTKANTSLLFKKFCYLKNKGIKLSKIAETLKVNYRTVQKWEYKMTYLEKIHKVKIDDALKSLYFTSKKEIELFNFLTKDINFWEKYEEIVKTIPISRYYFRRVKGYIIEQVDLMED